MLLNKIRYTIVLLVTFILIRFIWSKLEIVFSYQTLYLESQYICYLFYQIFLYK